VYRFQRGRLGRLFSCSTLPTHMYLANPPLAAAPAACGGPSTPPTYAPYAPLYLSTHLWQPPQQLAVDPVLLLKGELNTRDPPTQAVQRLKEVDVVAAGTANATVTQHVIPGKATGQPADMIGQSAPFTCQQRR
jgi:hypothetical protein